MRLLGCREQVRRNLYPASWLSRPILEAPGQPAANRERVWQRRKSLAYLVDNANSRLPSEALHVRPNPAPTTSGALTTYTDEHEALQ
jgi:hypothetical protein